MLEATTCTTSGCVVTPRQGKTIYCRRLRPGVVVCFMHMTRAREERSEDDIQAIELNRHTTCMNMHGSVVSLSFIFPHPPEDNIYCCT